MPERETTESTKPRLNPFAFPSDLDLRFALVIVLVLSASVFLFDGLWMSWPDHSSWFVDMARQCGASGLSLPPDLGIGDLLQDPSDTTIGDTAARAQAINQCWRPVQQAIGQWIVAGLAVLLLLAVAIYLALPRWTIRRYGLTAFDAEEAPELGAELSALCREAGLTRLPTFLLEPLSSEVSGLAFGRLGQYYVSITGGLLVTYYTDAAAFRAVVRHELAHLRNRDVDKTYFVVAIWWAFVVAAVIPFAITLPSSDLGWAISLAWRGAALALIVYLTRNAVLRAREAHADLRASVWDGPTGALRRMVESLPAQPTGIGRSIWQVHPQPGERRRLIDETDGLFRANAWDAVGAGLAVSIGYSGLNLLAYQLFGGWSSVEVVWWAAALFVAPFVVGVVGVGIWRQTFASLVRSQSPVVTGRLGLGLGLGTVLGSVLALPAAVDQSLPSGGLGGPIELWISQGLWDLGLVLGLIIFVRWLAVGANTWLGALGGSPRSRRAMVAGLVLGGFLLTWWYGLMVGIERLATTMLTDKGGLDGALLVAATLVGEWVWVLAQSPWTLIAFTAFWTFPIAAGLWRSRNVISERGWAFLDVAPDLPSWRGEAPRLGSLLTIGLRLGLAYAVLLLVVRVAFRLAVPEAIQVDDGVKLAYFVAQMGSAVLFAAIAAGMAASRLPRLWIIAGLAAASIVAATSAISILGLNLALGGGAEPGFVWLTFSSAVNQSVLVALPVALVCARRADRRLGQRERPEPLDVEGGAFRAA